MAGGSRFKILQEFQERRTGFEFFFIQRAITVLVIEFYRLLGRLLGIELKTGRGRRLSLNNRENCNQSPGMQSDMPIPDEDPNRDRKGNKITHLFLVIVRVGAVVANAKTSIRSEIDLITYHFHLPVTEDHLKPWGCELPNLVEHVVSHRWCRAWAVP